jgi:hypothetical protein
MLRLDVEELVMVGAAVDYYSMQRDGGRESGRPNTEVTKETLLLV